MIIVNRDAGGKLPRQYAVPMHPMNTSNATGARRLGSTTPNSARIQNTKPAFSTTAIKRVLVSSLWASSAVKSLRLKLIHWTSRTRQIARRAAGSASLSHGDTVDGRTSPTLILSTSNTA